MLITINFTDVRANLDTRFWTEPCTNNTVLVGVKDNRGELVEVQEQIEDAAQMLTALGYRTRKVAGCKGIATLLKVQQGVTK
jgi:hypothetical protein